MRELLEWLKKATKWLFGDRKTPLQSIDWTVVTSSCVHAIKYDAENEVMYVQFTDMAVYDYSTVRASVAVEMLHSLSKGKFMWSRIRGRYVYHRLQPKRN